VLGLERAHSTPWGVTLPEDVVRREAENIAALAPAHEDIEDLVQKVTFLEGELVEACRA
jgi:hypothetical protein